MTDQNQKKHREFIMEEARWLDSVVRPFIPKWVQWLVEKNAANILGRTAHFFVDYFYIGKILKIKITRNQDTELPGGKGFRKNVDHGYKIRSIRTTITKRGKEIATKRFFLNITIKQ